MSKRNLKGATVVITGASSGVGRAAALAFATRGANLVLAARGYSSLLSLVKECKKRGGSAVGVKTDVTDAESVAHLAEIAGEKFSGFIDVWINNAGVGAFGPFDSTPIESHEQVIRVNLLGYINGAYAAVPFFKRQRTGGVLINMNSAGGFVAQPYAVAYSASKHGLRGFSEALRGELNRWPQIQVCDIYPAFLDTPGLSHGANYSGRELKPAPALTDPRSVAKTMVQLAEQPKKEVVLDAPTLFARLSRAFAPDATRQLVSAATDRYLENGPPASRTDGNLFKASTKNSITGRGNSSHKGVLVGLGAIAVLAGLGLYWAKRKNDEAGFATSETDLPFNEVETAPVTTLDEYALQNPAASDLPSSVPVTVSRLGKSDI